MTDNEILHTLRYNDCGDCNQGGYAYCKIKDCPIKISINRGIEAIETLQKLKVSAALDSSDLEKMIKKLERASYKKPERCKDCKYCVREPDFIAELQTYYCKLIEDGYESIINYEIDRDTINYYCPLMEDDEREETLKLLGWLKELLERRQKEEA